MNTGIKRAITLTTTTLTLTTLASVAPAAAEVTIEHYPRRIKVVNSGYVCLHFGPRYEGDSAYPAAVDVTARGGIRYPENYCDPTGKTKKRLKSRKGLTFTVRYAYTHDVQRAGTRRHWWIDEWNSGWRYRNAAGQLLDDWGNVVATDELSMWIPGHRVILGPARPWPYEENITSRGRYKTTIRLVK